MDLAKVGDTLSILLAGNVVTTWEAPDGESYSVKLRVPKPARRQELLDVLTVSGRPESNGLSNMIPVSSLIDFTERVSPPHQITRFNMMREITVHANIAGRDAGTVCA